MQTISLFTHKAPFVVVREYLNPISIVRAIRHRIVANYLNVHFLFASLTFLLNKDLNIDQVAKLNMIFDRNVQYPKQVSKRSFFKDAIYTAER